LKLAKFISCPTRLGWNNQLWRRGSRRKKSLNLSRTLTKHLNHYSLM